MFENRVLRRVFGPKRDEVTGEWRTLHNEELNDLYSVGRPGLCARTACSFRSAQAATLLEFMYHSRIVLSVGGSVWYMIRNLRCTVTIDSVLAISKTQNAFLFTVNAIFLHDYLLAVEPVSTPRPLVQKKTWRDSVPIDVLLSAVSVLVVAQSSSEIPEGLMNNPV